MKRVKRELSSNAGRTGAIDPKRLTAVRGGSLGITVDVPGPAPSIMQIQHNEPLLRAGGSR